MPLTPGQALSFYEILGPLGVGGMGEVYRAKDTRLEREAKTLESLNHPNIAGIHGVDEADGCASVPPRVVRLVVGGEAWDGAVYFASLPALAVICLALGARDRERAWRWGAFAAVGQAVGLVATAGAGASLLPVGLALLAGLGAGLALCSWLGAKLAGGLGAERG